MTTLFIPGLTTSTTSSMEFYADGDSGDDANDGLTVSTPKKTLQDVSRILPQTIKHNTRVNLSGTFSEYGAALFTVDVNDGAYFIIDGGSDVTVVDDDGGSPYTSDINSTSSIGLTTAGWTPDEFAGYWVEIVSGAMAGTMTLIQGHDATTITPAKNFSSDPGAGATFRIVRPATTLASSTATSSLGLLSRNAGYTSYVQRLYFSGTKSYFWNRNGSAFRVAGIVSDCVSVGNGFLQSVGGYTSVNLTSVVDASFANDFDWAVGCSVRQSAFDMQNSTANLLGIYAKLLRIRGGSVFKLSFGSRVLELLCEGTSAAGANGARIYNTPGFADVSLGDASVAVGVTVNDGGLSIEDDVDISNCTSHGIECVNSRLHLDGAVTGSSNSGAGVYAHSGSVVHINDGGAPTLTGTIGDLSTDGTTQESTWAAIDGGTPVAVLAEMTMAKEV